MTIAEMHVWFRQYAQQMGMQNVRAILPEQIDTLINTSIKDTIDEVINRNVGITNDRVITDNAKLANINALRTLYKVKTVVVGDSNNVASYGNNPYKFDSSEIGEVLYFVDFAIRYSDNSTAIATARGEYEAALRAYKTAISTYNASVETYKAAKAAYDADPTDTDKQQAYEDAEAAMNAAEQAIATTKGTLDLKLSNFKEAIEADTGLTRWFPIRIIDDAYLADVLNDWVLSPRMRTPAMVVYAKEGSNIESTFELYIGENEESGISEIVKNYYISQIRCSYIKAPNKVRYVSDIGGQNVDSDLPEQLQIPMLKHAVDLYRASISGSLFAAQQNQQENGRELSRNNARPENDGYQS